MPNPVFVETTRGSIVESFHRGAVSVCDGQGTPVLDIGDTQVPIFPRSAVKAIQALPLIESGAAEALHLEEQEIAVACSSHSGQPMHIETVRRMLQRAGLTESELECGGHWSFVNSVMRDQAREFESTPTAVWNNCSGKHAGFLCTAAHLGWSTTGYIDQDHEVQKNIRSVLENVMGQPHDSDICGTDGCSIPTYAVPLKAMATGFAKMVTGQGLGPLRAAAAKRILTACMNEPFFVAGDDRFCTSLMKLDRGRLFGKTGAEGVYCAAIPELGVGIAVKADDGGTRAAEVMISATISHLLPADDPLQTSLKSLASYSIKNWNGNVTGETKIRWPEESN